MSALGPEKIVVLGMMTKMPVAGVVWQTIHYLVGLERLGYEVWYVEAHARTPSMLMDHEEDDGAALAAAFIDRVLRRFGLGGRWAYHALHDDGRCYGLSERELASLYRSAALIVNLHGGTRPLPEHHATGRLVYVETDPVQLQIELHDGVQETVDFLEPHVAFFTFGENYGRADCLLPVSDRFRFRATRQPVVLDFWADGGEVRRDRFTTIGNWQQSWRTVELGGEAYSWSKHDQFARFLDLPTRTGSRFELALSSYEDQDRVLLEDHGWSVRPALDVSRDLDPYRDYIRSSKGEFTVAKDQNVRLRTGWFSDRSATYLAAGRPVITQDTAFGNILPTGEGLFAFSDLEGAAAAVQAIESDPRKHQAAAAALAREFFCARTVLTDLLGAVGLSPRAGRPGGTRGDRRAVGTDEARKPIETELAELRAVAASMSEALSLREAELAGLLRAVGRAEIEGVPRIGYIEARCRLRAVVERLVPMGCAVAVVAKGGDDLLRFGGRAVQCIPQDRAGRPLSFHPSCGLAAIAQAELARFRGADYLVLPQWSAWWLDSYPELARHLDHRYRRVLADDDATIWSFRERAEVRPLVEAIAECEHVLGRTPVILDWQAGVELGGMFPHCVVFAGEGDGLPFLDDTVDVVALADPAGRRRRVAERVAATAVLALGGSDCDAVVHWVGHRHQRAEETVSVVVSDRPEMPLDQRSFAMLEESLPPYVTSEVIVVGGTGHPAPLGGSVTTCTTWREVARAAKGETIVVLDSSTVALPGWLPPLLRTRDARPGAGVVCGMVLAADGELVQPAPARPGRYDIAAAGCSHVRRLDECVGTLLAMPRDLFSAAAENAATDFGPAAAATARRADRPIVYQPEAVGVWLGEPRGRGHG